MSDVEYIACNDCGTLVPEANLAIHQARQCGNRARGTTITEIRDDSSTPPPKRTRRKDRNGTQSMEQEENVKDDPVQVSEVIDLTESSPPRNPESRPPARSETRTEEWSCPQCTLINPRHQSRCEACNYANPELRAPDATRRERLVDDFGPTSPTVLNVGGGALLGSLLGGAASYMRGRSVADGMVEGAVSGAVGGAIVDSMLRPMSTPRRSISQARTSSAMGHAAYPTFSDQTTSSRARPRQSFQVRRQMHNGRITTTVIQSDGTMRYGGDEDPMMALMMSMGMLRQDNMMGQPNIDNMNYDALLQAFGDGTENMGADEGDILQLPVSVISDPEKELPKDARQCCICLEDFEAGCTRKTLPCLHGFHQECIDRALRNRGCCPICNQSVK